ncbi:hypothetical protein C8R44DRAFT_730375 [Mycena epipterygia]|nr:hypothetical protein C8R44DRAFT_730375 [Mycena epipterygia]
MATRAVCIFGGWPQRKQNNKEEQKTIMHEVLTVRIHGVSTNTSSRDSHCITGIPALRAAATTAAGIASNRSETKLRQTKYRDSSVTKLCTVRPFLRSSGKVMVRPLKPTARRSKKVKGRAGRRGGRARRPSAAGPKSHYMMRSAQNRTEIVRERFAMEKRNNCDEEGMRKCKREDQVRLDARGQGVHATHQIPQSRSASLSLCPLLCRRFDVDEAVGCEGRLNENGVGVGQADSAKPVPRMGTRNRTRNTGASSEIAARGCRCAFWVCDEG